MSLEALYEERSVTRAARRLGLSQPAMSHRLAQLRQIFGDPLFVREGRGLSPTARCEAVITPLRSAMSELERTLATPAEFDPNLTERRFHVAANSLVHAVWLRPLLTAIWAEAPSANIDVHPLSTSIDPGQVDAVFAGMKPVGTGWDYRKVIEDEFVWIYRRGSLGSAGESDRQSTLQQWCQRPHVVVIDTMPSWVDGWLTERGLTRRVALRVGDFASVPPLVAETDLVSLVPAHLIENALGLEHRPSPLPMPMIRGYMWWPQRLSADPAIRWLRAVVDNTIAARRP